MLQFFDECGVVLFEELYVGLEARQLELERVVESFELPLLRQQGIVFCLGGGVAGEEEERDEGGEEGFGVHNGGYKKEPRASVED